MPGLDDFLDQPAEEAQADPESAPETEPEKGDLAPDPAPPAEELKPAEADKGLQAALLAERRRRQEVEAAYARQKEEERPFLGEEYEARFKETEARFEQRLTNAKLDLSESFARKAHPDYQEKFDVFAQLVQDNPAIYQQMIQEADPAEFAYRTAANQVKLKEMGDPTEYENKLRTKIEAEVKAKYQAEYETESKKRQELPGSLADTRGVAGTQQKTWEGPPGLADILS